MAATSVGKSGDRAVNGRPATMHQAVSPVAMLGRRMSDDDRDEVPVTSDAMAADLKRRSAPCPLAFPTTLADAGPEPAHGRRAALGAVHALERTKTTLTPLARAAARSLLPAGPRPVPEVRERPGMIGGIVGKARELVRLAAARQAAWGGAMLRSRS